MTNMTTRDTSGDGAKLIAIEKATVAAFKAKADAEFTRHFSPAYIGIADDGFKTGADEVAGMHELDLDELVVEDEKAFFPAAGTGIVTYVMKVKGRAGPEAVAGKIYTSTVYVETDTGWSAVLHTESMSPG